MGLTSDKADKYTHTQNREGLYSSTGALSHGTLLHFSGRHMRTLPINNSSNARNAVRGVGERQNEMVSGGRRLCVLCV